MLSHIFQLQTSGGRWGEKRHKSYWESFASESSSAEGLGRHCLCQTHCLKLKKISWAPATESLWYDSYKIYSSSVERRLCELGSLGAGRGRCVYFTTAVQAGETESICNAVSAE